MRRLAWVVLPVLLLMLYLSVHRATWEERAQLRQNSLTGYVLPSRFSRILAFGNQGLLSDFLFLKTVTFLGERIQQEQVLTEQDWQFVSRNIEVVTDLDPYFLDPYVLAQGIFTWEADRPEEAIRFLEKGYQYAPQQWRLPFYIGFDYFYFLGDYAKGGEYLMEAARIPGSYGFLPNLAARLSYYGDKAQTAILFLKDMHSQTEDSRLREKLELRIIALERADLLEQALVKYQVDRGQAPDVVFDLVAGGYIDHLPEEPYGGEWVILENGRIFSTSKFVQKKPSPDK
jgi:tetratricopeptide (TPR) repeat protein